MCQKRSFNHLSAFRRSTLRRSTIAVLRLIGKSSGFAPLTLSLREGTARIRCPSGGRKACTLHSGGENKNVVEVVHTSNLPGFAVPHYDGSVEIKRDGSELHSQILLKGMLSLSGLIEPSESTRLCHDGIESRNT
jgi:hypothetical protein